MGVDLMQADRGKEELRPPGDGCQVTQVRTHLRQVG